MDVNFGVIVAWSAVLGIIALFGFGIRHLFKQIKGAAQHQIELKRIYQERKSANKISKTFLPASRFKEITESSILETELLYMAMVEEAENGRLKYSTSHLGLWMNSYRVLSSLNYNFRKHPVLMILGALLLLPISWIVILIGAVIIVYHSSQVGKMELAFTQYLNGSANSNSVSSAPTNVSTADELKKLSGLKADGILTDEEFQKAKTKLLAS